jgi:hypothetical protein
MRTYAIYECSRKVLITLSILWIVRQSSYNRLNNAYRYIDLDNGQYSYHLQIHPFARL